MYSHTGFFCAWAWPTTSTASSTEVRDNDSPHPADTSQCHRTQSGVHDCRWAQWLHEARCRSSCRCPALVQRKRALSRLFRSIPLLRTASCQLARHGHPSPGRQRMLPLSQPPPMRQAGSQVRRRRCCRASMWPPGCPPATLPTCRSCCAQCTHMMGCKRVLERPFSRHSISLVTGDGGCVHNIATMRQAVTTRRPRRSGVTNAHQPSWNAPQQAGLGARCRVSLCGPLLRSLPAATGKVPPPGHVTPTALFALLHHQTRIVRPSSMHGLQHPLLSYCVWVVAIPLLADASFGRLPVSYHCRCVALRGYVTTASCSIVLANENAVGLLLSGQLCQRDEQTDARCARALTDASAATTVFEGADLYWSSRLSVFVWQQKPFARRWVGGGCPKRAGGHLVPAHRMQRFAAQGTGAMALERAAAAAATAEKQELRSER